MVMGLGRLLRLSFVVLNLLGWHAVGGIRSRPLHHLLLLLARVLVVVLLGDGPREAPSRGVT
jgi:hypothetical protein